MNKLEHYLAGQPDQLTENPSLLRREIAYERLKDALQHGDLEPGEVLSETRLSLALGISRTPVREALHQLAQEGLVQVIPGRAVTVAAPSVRSVLNVVHMRLLLEPELVRLATETIDRGGECGTWNMRSKKWNMPVSDDDHMAWSRRPIPIFMKS